jgi:hypothetical protein
MQGGIIVSLLVTEINELRQMLKNFNAGTISTEEFNTKINGYAQIEKRERLFLQAWALAIKSGYKNDAQRITKQLIGAKPFDLKSELPSRTAKRGT